MHKVRTARGDVIDFDEVRVKQSLAQTPANIQVKAREQFIDQRIKRTSKRRAALLSQQLLDQNAEEVAQVAEDAEVAQVTEDVEVAQVETVDEPKPSRAKMTRRPATTQEAESE